MNKEDFGWELRYYAPYGLHNPEGRIFWKSTFVTDVVEVRDFSANDNPPFAYEVYNHITDESYAVGTWQEAVLVIAFYME